ncbi:transposase [Streptomyces olivoreticuli]
MVLDGPRPVTHVAQELGIHDTTLGNWVKVYKRNHSGQSPDTGGKKSERERELERENRKLREQVEFLKKRQPSSRPGISNGQVRVDRHGEGSSRGHRYVRVAGGVALRILRVAVPASLGNGRTP